MPVLVALSAALAWLGRQGTRAVAVTIFLGIALPPLAALFKPFFTEALFALLYLAFLRVEPAALRGQFAKPGAVAAATVWIMLVVPALVGAALLALGLHAYLPGLFVALVLQAAAPPVISAPTLAALMGLDAAFALAALITCTVLTPLTAPLFAALFIGADTALAPLPLGLKLFALLAGAAAAAAVTRRLIGRSFIERHTERIDGLSVIVLFFFAVALMDGVLINTMQRPLFVAGLVALSFALAAILTGVTALLFARIGRSRALALGFAAGSRNMGLMLAAAAGAVPELTWLYFAIAQLPIYLLPQALKLLAGAMRGTSQMPGPRA